MNRNVGSIWVTGCGHRVGHRPTLDGNMIFSLETKQQRTGSHLQVQEDLLQQAAAAFLCNGVQNPIHAGLGQRHALFRFTSQVLPFQTDDGFSVRKQARLNEATENTSLLPFHSGVALCPHGHLLKGLAVVDDGDHILDVAVRVLPVPEVLLFIRLGLLFVSGNTQPPAEPLVRGGLRGVPDFTRKSHLMKTSGFVNI